MKILIDNSVTSYGRFAKTIGVDVAGWANKLILIEAKPENSDNDLWLRDQIEALPTISRLAREGQLELFTYSELRHEAGRWSGSFPAPMFGDVFKLVKISHVKPQQRTLSVFGSTPVSAGPCPAKHSKNCRNAS